MLCCGIRPDLLHPAALTKADLDGHGNKGGDQPPVRRRLDVVLGDDRLSAPGDRHHSPGAVTFEDGSAVVSRAISRSKLKSEAASPVMSREPRLKVRSWIAHLMNTTMRLWNWTMYIRWISAQMSQAGSPAR